MDREEKDRVRDYLQKNGFDDANPDGEKNFKRPKGFSIYSRLDRYYSSL